MFCFYVYWENHLWTFSYLWALDDTVSIWLPPCVQRGKHPALKIFTKGIERTTYQAVHSRKKRMITTISQVHPMENHLTVNSWESLRRGRLWSHWRGWSNLKEINWDRMMCWSMWWKFKPVHVPAVSAVSLPGMTTVYREKQVGYFPKGIMASFFTGLYL